MPKTFTPMRLLRIPQPFDHDDFIFEVKFDGFRALAHIDGGRCTLISRNGHSINSWPQLQEEIVRSVQGQGAVLDGEMVCLEPDGRPNFRKLLFLRESSRRLRSGYSRICLFKRSASSPNALAERRS